MKAAVASGMFILEEKLKSVAEKPLELQSNNAATVPTGLLLDISSAVKNPSSAIPAEDDDLDFDLEGMNLDENIDTSDINIDDELLTE
mgnify:CR=1 FL=1